VATSKGGFYYGYQETQSWNWFHHEEEQARNVSVQRGVPQIYSPLAQLHRDIDRMIGNVLA
jgi:hypothetical protein